MFSHLEGLNPPQKEAVLHIEGPLLIVAGAGAGKTKTLTHRVLHLIKNGVPPEAILAITFTNKAAREMRERVFHLLKKEAGDGADFRKVPFISTFHSLGVHILRANALALGLPRHFTILDKSDALSFVKAALQSEGLDPKQFDPKRILDIISKQKGECVSVENFLLDARGKYFLEISGRVWKKYEGALKKEGALDFDDLLLKTHILLRDNREVREHYQNLWKYVHVDEYQDTNALQYELSRTLAEPEKNICVVGDADQNIYGWRGANIRNILHFEKDFPGAKVVLLEENYRSTQNILSAANDVIRKNVLRVEKNLFTKNGEGEKIKVFESYDETEEAKYVTEKVAELLSEKIPGNDIAVLFRANYQSRAIEEAMIGAGISYTMLGVKFFERKEVKDTLSFLRAALNPESTLDLKRVINVPARGIGETTLGKILRGEKEKLPPAMRKKVDEFETLLQRIREAAGSKKPSETIAFIIEATGMKKTFREGGEEGLERLENLGELMSIASRFDASPPEEGIIKLLEDAALSNAEDEAAENANAVKLMTVHSSKGLEFRAVFITGLEDGLFPHVSFGGDTTPSKDRAEEERRLFYVALTRAKEKLFLTHASVRTVFGSRQINAPSEFLSDIDEAYTEVEEREASFGEGRIIHF